MDQTELGMRVALSRTTISSIENGKGVNAASLFHVLEHFELLDDIQAVIDEKLDETDNKLSRKSRLFDKELSNDF